MGELLFARGLEEVRRGAAHIVDITLELGVVREDLGFAHDALAAAHLHHAALVEGERAEGALAKAPAVAGDGEADLVEGRNASGCIVVGVPVARVGQLGHFVHLTFGEGRRGWVLHHVDAVGIGLHQASARDGVHVLLLDVEGARVGEAIFLEHVPGGEQLVVEDVVQRPRAACAVDRSVHEGDLIHGQPAVERVCHLDDRVLAHAVEQDVGAGIEQDGALELVLPVVVVREAAQARLDAADDDGLVLKGAADEVAVDRDGAVGTCARASAGGVGVLMARLLVNGVVVHHRVHVAGRDEKAQARLAERGDARRIGPVGLADDAYAVARMLEHAGDDRHAEARVVHIGVAADVDEVALVPAPCLHIVARDGEEGLAAGAPLGARAAGGSGGVLGFGALRGCVILGRMLGHAARFHSG